MSLIKDASNAINKATIDTTNRDASAEVGLHDREGVGKADMKDAGARVDAAERNVKAIGTDAVNLAKDTATVGTGIFNVGKGVLGALKDLLDSGYHGVASMKYELDAEAKAIRNKENPSATEIERAEHLEMMSANLAAIKEDDWATIKKGLKQIVDGVKFAAIDLASMPVDAAQALRHLVAAAGLKIKEAYDKVKPKVVGAVKAAFKAVVGFFKAIGRGLAKIGKAIVNFFKNIVWGKVLKPAGQWVAGAFNSAKDSISEAADKVKAGAKHGVASVGAWMVEKSGDPGFEVRRVETSMNPATRDLSTAPTGMEPATAGAK